MKINKKTNVAGIFAGDIKQARRLEIGSEVVLVREPNNQFDANAVKVCVEKKGFFSKSLSKIGYIEKETASKLAQMMDSGITIKAVVAYMKDYNNYPVIDVRVTSI